MSDWRMRVERQLRRAGIVGGVGVALLAFIPGYYLTIIRPLEAQADDLSREVAMAATGKRAADDAPRLRQARLQAFHGFFPSAREVPGWIAKIYAAADAEGLALPRGEYRRAVSSAQDASPVSLRISLPTKGSYPQIRRFVTTALAEVPMLALDEISFQRQAANEQQLEAEIRFTLFVGAEP